MGLTIAEKILARASGKKSVNPGQYVTATVDLAMVHHFSTKRFMRCWSSC